MAKKRKKFDGPKTRVNIVSVLNTEGAHTETLNGREVMVVQSATLPDDVVMNDILYPAEEIQWSYHSLNRTPAPLGHPLIDGKFVSASDPEGLNLGYIGAFNDNAEQRDGRVFIDKIIDIAVAKQSKKGRQLIDLINAGKPIHTSVGAYLNLEEVKHDDYRFIARNMYFDHDAILVDEKGAATPDQGVGMMVNKRKAMYEGKEIAVINSSVIDHLGDDIDWAEQNSHNSAIQKLAEMFANLLKPAGKTAQIESEGDMSDNTKEFDALAKKVTDLQDGIGEAITNAVKTALEPVLKSVSNIEAASTATANAEKAKYIEAIVANKLLTQKDAEDSTLASLKAIVASSKAQKTAAPVFGGGAQVVNGKTDIWANYDLNKGEDAVSEGAK